MGFWVATTMNGSSSLYDVPSTVTWCSSMHSSNADWVLADARLISSPMTMFANTAPGRNSKSLEAWLYMDTPVTSEGSRSGVNWMRLTVQSMVRARVLASRVLPTPGTSSTSRWPWARRTVSASLAASDLPSITVLTVLRMRWAAAWKDSASMAAGRCPFSWLTESATPARLRFGALPLL